MNVKGKVTLLKMVKRLKRKMRKMMKIVYHGRSQFSVNIPIKIVKNLKIKRGDLFEFITDRKKEVQKFRIIKK